MITIKLYTSYFANNKKIPKEIKRISIAKFSPRWIKCDSYSPAAPPIDLLYNFKNKEICEKEYIEIYNKHLNSLDGNLVITHLKQLSGGKDIVFLCYENSDKFCHRHLFLDWLKQFCNESIEACGEFGAAS